MMFKYASFFFIRYAEENNYNYATGTGTGVIGHFTQVVWKASTKVGVGIATSGPNTWIVAKYMPAGNVIGNYISNVGLRKAGGKRGSIKNVFNKLCCEKTSFTFTKFYIKHTKKLFYD